MGNPKNVFKNLFPMPRGIVNLCTIESRSESDKEFVFKQFQQLKGGCCEASSIVRAAVEQCRFNQIKLFAGMVINWVLGTGAGIVISLELEVGNLSHAAKTKIAAYHADGVAVVCMYAM